MVRSHGHSEGICSPRTSLRGDFILCNCSGMVVAQWAHDLCGGIRSVDTARRRLAEVERAAAAVPLVLLPRIALEVRDHTESMTAKDHATGQVPTDLRRCIGMDVVPEGVFEKITVWPSSVGHP